MTKINLKKILPTYLLFFFFEHVTPSIYIFFGHMQSFTKNKNCFLGVFLGWYLKKPFSYQKLTPSNFSKRKFLCENKNLKIQGQKCLIWVFFGQNLKVLFSYLKSIYKSETKYALFGYFWSGVLKSYCHIRNQRPRICLFAKLVQ